MYSVGDMIVHPLHGAGVIESLVTRDVRGEKLDYYVMSSNTGHITVMIPVDSSDSIGVRSLVSAEEAEEVLLLFKEKDGGMSDNWNKRYRENMTKLKSGDLRQVATVVRGLLCRDMRKGLSTGERKMLHNAKQIFYSELVLALGRSEEEIERQIVGYMEQ